VDKEEIARRARELGVPVVQPLPKINEQGNPNPVVMICGECGKEWHMIEGYSCGNGRCPVQPHAIC
jgi:hypothetical protein